MIKPLLTLFLPLFFTCSAIAEAPYPDPERFRQNIEQFLAQENTARPPKNAIVALGSSSMLGWHGRIAEDLAPLSIIPRGFGGSNMYDARYFLKELVLRHKPRAVMLYEGDNDAALGASTEQVMQHFIAIVHTLHTELPDTRLYIFAVKPSIARWNIWPAMLNINEALKSFSETDPLITYVDVATPMLGDDGRPIESIFVADMLHMNDRGYDIWRDAVRPVVYAAEKSFE